MAESWAIGSLGLVGVLCLVTGLALLLTTGRTNSDQHRPGWLRHHLTSPRFIEKTVYRHHRIFGAVLVAAAAFWLWLLSPLAAWHGFLELTRTYLAQLLGSGVATILIAALLASVALVIGLMLALRPSLLKPLEARTNRRIAGGYRYESGERPHGNIVDITWNRSRIAGVVLLVGAFMCLYAFFRLVDP